MELIKYKNDFIVFENNTINNLMSFKYKDIKQKYMQYSKSNALKEFKKLINGSVV